MSPRPATAPTDGDKIPAAVEAVRDRLRDAAATARAKLTAAQTALDVATVAQTAAEARDFAEANEASEKALHSAHAVSTLARSRASLAAHASETAARELLASEEVLERARVDARKTELNGVASSERLASAIAAPWANALGAYRVLVESAEAVSAAYKRSADASKELRSLGDNVANLDPLHAVAPAFADMVRRGVTPRDLDAVRSQWAGATSPAAGVFALLSEHAGRDPAPPGYVEAFRERMRLMGATRTAHEAAELGRLELGEAGDSNALAREAHRLSAGGPTLVPVETRHGLQMRTVDLSGLECGHVLQPRLRADAGGNLQCIRPG